MEPMRRLCAAAAAPALTDSLSTQRGPRAARCASAPRGASSRARASLAAPAVPGTTERVTRCERPAAPCRAGQLGRRPADPAARPPAPAFPHQPAHASRPASRPLARSRAARSPRPPRLLAGRAARGPARPATAAAPALHAHLCCKLFTLPRQWLVTLSSPRPARPPLPSHTPSDRMFTQTRHLGAAHAGPALPAVYSLRTAARPGAVQGAVVATRAAQRARAARAHAQAGRRLGSSSASGAASLPTSASTLALPGSSSSSASAAAAGAASKKL